MSLPASIDTLIVGAGPSGLALACELARRGVPHLVIDRQPAGANTSRACVIHARTLEVLEPLGLVPKLLARGLKVQIFRVRDRDRALMSVDFGNLPSRYAYTLMLPQSDTEAVLLETFRQHGGTVQRPYELTMTQCDAGGATATIRDAEGDHIVRARYMVGCDGMHSRVRELAGIAFDGGSYAEAFVLGDVHMKWPLSREEVTLFYSPAGMMVVAPIPDQRFRIVASVEKALVEPTAGDIQNLLDARGPTAPSARVTDVVWSSRFHIQHRVAREFRKGPFLLVGDAAHVHSPAGGQGMNTGIQDAISLGGAMTTSTRSGTDDALDDWAVQRHRTASKVVSLTDRMTRLATIQNPAGQALRNAVVQVLGHFPPAQHAMAMRLSELTERAA
jgi:2-polyprenyl-6-methoxyphenol hydroxylase-like FAD-dependent oxidoreductase